MPEYYTERKSHWHNHLNMMFDSITGEAIAVNVIDDGQRIYIPTGLFFERVVQMQLDEHGQPLAGSETWAKAQPWGWATEGTANEMLALLAAAMPEAQLSIGYGDVNTRFPFYYPDGERARQRELHVKVGDQLVRLNAGLTAQTFGRHITVDPATGKVRRSRLPIQLAATAAIAEAAEQAAKSE